MNEKIGRKENLYVPHKQDAALIAHEFFTNNADSPLAKQNPNLNITPKVLEAKYSPNKSEQDKFEEKWQKFGDALLMAVRLGAFGDPRVATDPNTSRINFDQLPYVSKIHQKHNQWFTGTLQQESDSRPLTESEQRLAKWYEDHAVDITNPDTNSREQTDRVNRNFSSSNFLYHGSSTEAMARVLKSGVLMNSVALRQKGISANRGGTEGISWSLNGIDVLPGERYHIAGFLAAPERVLQPDEKLAVPTNPAIFEVQQMPANIDDTELSRLRIQDALFYPYHIRATNKVKAAAGEKMSNKDDNSIYQSLKFLLDNPKKTDPPPGLVRWVNGIKDPKQTIAKLQKNESGSPNYKLGDDGHISLNPYLSQFKKSERQPIAAYYIQAAIDAGKFKGTVLDSLNAIDVVKTLSQPESSQFSEVKDNLGHVLFDDLKYHQKQHDDFQKKHSAPVEVPVEQMYFVCAKGDIGEWSEFIAKSGHRPLGIMTYDNESLRIPDWKTRFGDHDDMSRQLSNAIRPNNQHISYDEVLGTTFDDSKRAFDKHYVIAEKALKKRKSIRKDQRTGQLKVV